MEYKDGRYFLGNFNNGTIEGDGYLVFIWFYRNGQMEQNIEVLLLTIKCQDKVLFHFQMEWLTKEVLIKILDMDLELLMKMVIFMKVIGKTTINLVKEYWEWKMDQIMKENSKMIYFMVKEN